MVTHSIAKESSCDAPRREWARIPGAIRPPCSTTRSPTPRDEHSPGIPRPNPKASTRSFTQAVFRPNPLRRSLRAPRFADPGYSRRLAQQAPSACSKCWKTTATWNCSKLTRRAHVELSQLLLRGESRRDAGLGHDPGGLVEYGRGRPQFLAPTSRRGNSCSTHAARLFVFDLCRLRPLKQSANNESTKPGPRPACTPRCRTKQNRRDPPHRRGVGTLRRTVQIQQHPRCSMGSDSRPPPRKPDVSYCAGNHKPNGHPSELVMSGNSRKGYTA